MSTLGLVSAAIAREPPPVGKRPPPPQDVNQHDFVAALAAMDPLTEHRHGRVDGCFRLRCIFRIFDDDADGHLNRSIPLASIPLASRP